MVKKQAAKEYAVKRGTRREKMLQTWLYSKIVKAAQTEYGDWNESNWHESPPEFAAMMQSPETVEAFCRIVLYTDRSNGSHSLGTGDGKSFPMPDCNASPEELLTAFWEWMGIDESVTDAIDARILAMNARQVDPELQPKGDLTVDERADPN